MSCTGGNNLVGSQHSVDYKKLSLDVERTSNIGSSTCYQHHTQRRACRASHAATVLVVITIIIVIGLLLLTIWVIISSSSRMTSDGQLNVSNKNWSEELTAEAGVSYELNDNGTAIVWPINKSIKPNRRNWRNRHDLNDYENFGKK
jgi:hypothetical protein